MSKTVTLREYFERVLAERELRYAQKFESSCLHNEDLISGTSVTMLSASLPEAVEPTKAPAEPAWRICGFFMSGFRAIGESRGEGGVTARASSRVQTQWIIPLAVTIGLWLLGGVGTLLFFFLTRK